METTLTEGRPFKIILKFMIPLLIGNIFQQFYNMVDTIIVGKFVGEGLKDEARATVSNGVILSAMVIAVLTVL